MKQVYSGRYYIYARNCPETWVNRDQAKREANFRLRQPWQSPRC